MYGKTPKRIFMASTTMLLPYKNYSEEKRFKNLHTQHNALEPFVCNFRV